MDKSFSFEEMLHRLGGWSLIVIIALAQSIALLGALPGVLAIQVSAGLDPAQSRVALILVPFLIVFAHLILLVLGWRLTSAARRKLDYWSGRSMRREPGDDLLAWREITSLGWRCAVMTGIVDSLVVLLPLLLLAFETSAPLPSVRAAGSLPWAGPVYVLLGGTAGLLGVIVLAFLMIERFTVPVREILLPKDFETQLAGRSGLLVNRKILFLSLLLIGIATMLIAPLGFHSAVPAAEFPVTVPDSFERLQLQSLIFGALALMLGVGFSYLLSRSISDPVADLIETFNRIEQGDMTQRVVVSATDELGIVTIQFNRMVARLEALQGTLEQQVAERTRQLAASNEVGRVASTSLDPQELLARIIPLLDTQFGYYFAAIYLLDPSGKWAELKEATGEVGNLLKQNRHRLEVAGKSMVGTAIRERAPRIAQAASDEKQRLDNPLLPYTRSELALPLVAGNRVLGALNVQSSKEADFGPQVIETLKNMAGQVAIALENARLFQEAQEVIREMRAIQKQYLLEGWTGFSEDNKSLEYRLGDEVDENSKKMETPIHLRDQTLGQITLEQGEEWTAEQQNLVDAVAAQAAVALENARLVSETRQIAVRERMVAEINSRVWQAATIDSVLQTVVKELGRRLDASSATVELTTDNLGEDKS